MGRYWKHAGLTAMLSVSLAVAGGCQAVKGVDIGKAIEQQAATVSVEAKGAWSVQLIPGKGKFLSAEEEAAARILGASKLQLKRVAMQDSNHESIEGILSYEKASIPFLAEIDGDRLIVQLEGGKKPIVLKQAIGTAGIPSLSSMLAPELQKKSAELRNILTRFVVSNAPNPAKLDISQVDDTVNGQSLSLQKVHAELNGSELKELGKQFLKAAAADEKGMKELLGQLYDLFAPMLKANLQKQIDDLKKEELDLYGTDSGINGMNSLYIAYLDNKTLAVEFVYTTLKQYLDKAIAELDKPSSNADTVIGSTYQDSILSLFTDRLLLKTDLLLDSSNNVRKEHIELTLPTGDEQLEPIAGLRLVGDMELWNYNKPVSAATIPVDQGIIEVGGLEGADSDALLANFTPDSAAYKLLKDDLHITRQQVQLIFTDNEDYDFDASHPYITDSGVAMVPARFISERFGAKVGWDGEQQAVSIQDARSGASITLQLGSPIAILNGKPEQLGSAAVIKNGTAYVPLRFIAEALGAKLEWETETHIVTITRE